MSMHNSAFKNEIKHAGAHPYINAALDGDVKSARLFTSVVNSKCITPNDKFNAITSALQLLRFNPHRELINKPLDEVHEPGTLENLLISILNQSMDRKKITNYAYAKPNPRPLYSNETRDYCHEAELGFIYSATNQKDSKNKVHIDSTGEPVFFRKFFPRGVASALSLQKINYAGIELPPGTIIDLKEKHSERNIPHIGQLIVNHIDSGIVTSAYPLRLSSFALNDKDRFDTFGHYDQRGERITEFEQTATTEDIRNLLPESAFLAAQLSVKQVASDYKYAA